MMEMGRQRMPPIVSARRRFIRWKLVAPCSGTRAAGSRRTLSHGRAAEVRGKRQFFILDRFLERALFVGIQGVRRFQDPEKLVAYVGLNPGQHESGRGKSIKLGEGRRGEKHGSKHHMTFVAGGS